MDTHKRVIKQVERGCKERGLRFTEKRKQVFSLLLKSGKALSAYELIDIYKEVSGENLSAMSIYRILDFLTSEQLVHKLALTNKFVVCEHVCDQHDHSETQFLICERCQKVKEINLTGSVMNPFKNAVNNAGFYIASQQLEVNCICKECMENAA